MSYKDIDSTTRMFTDKNFNAQNQPWMDVAIAGRTDNCFRGVGTYQREALGRLWREDAEAYAATQAKIREKLEKYHKEEEEIELQRQKTLEERAKMMKQLQKKGLEHEKESKKDKKKKKKDKANKGKSKKSKKNKHRSSSSSDSSMSDKTKEQLRQEQLRKVDSEIAELEEKAQKAREAVAACQQETLEAKRSADEEECKSLVKKAKTD